MNIKQLEATLCLHDCTKGEAAKIMGISPSSFSRKCKNNGFNIAEANRLKNSLDLTPEEAMSIFFV